MSSESTVSAARPGPLPDRRRRRIAVLEFIGIVETVTLIVLLVNMATAHQQGITKSVGPVHGVLWVAGIVLTVLWTRSTKARVLSIIPALGPWFSARLMRRE